jgi:ATP-dependent helicase/DNAse subunit B
MRIADLASDSVVIQITKAIPVCSKSVKMMHEFTERQCTRMQVILIVPVVMSFDHSLSKEYHLLDVTPYSAV